MIDVIDYDFAITAFHSSCFTVVYYHIVKAVTKYAFTFALN